MHMEKYGTVSHIMTRNLSREPTQDIKPGKNKNDQ